MSTYQTPDGKLYDDMDGDALLLPSWPQDAQLITEEQAAAVRASQNTLSQQELIQHVMLDMKTRRLDIFRVLDTLQVDALTDGDAVKAQAIKQAKAAMTALNSIDLSAYTTIDQMQAAVQAAYYAIVSGAPLDVQIAFQSLVP